MSGMAQLIRPYTENIVIDLDLCLNFGVSGEGQETNSTGTRVTVLQADNANYFMWTRNVAFVYKEECFFAIPVMHGLFQYHKR